MSNIQSLLTTRPPFPMVLDSTIISAFRSCPRKAFLEYVLHFKSRVPSVHLHAGACFAKGLEVLRQRYYVDGDSSDEALTEALRAMVVFWGDYQEPDGHAKSLTRMLGALEYYANVAFPLDNEKAPPAVLPSGARAIEFSFNEPIGIDHPETGDPILYCGRMDQICNFAGGLYGEDDKTTSSLGPTWGNQWDLRSQFTGYVWGAQRSGLELSGFLVRGISILKTKYDHMPALTVRPQWQVDRWLEQTRHDIARMIECWRAGYWDYNIDTACDYYGGCPFKQVCLSQDPEPWLESAFERRVWDPVGRKETLLP